MRHHRLLVLAAVAPALFAAGCGGHRSAVTTTDSFATGGTAFAACMRAHGIPNWPDPVAGNVFDKAKLRALGIPPSRISAIQGRFCGHLIQGTPSPAPSAQDLQTKLADARSFARCMRSHGVARFPDPNANGDLSVEMVQAQGIDVHSPQVLHVVQTCIPASHGWLTVAKARAAIARAGG